MTDLATTFMALEASLSLFFSFSTIGNNNMIVFRNYEVGALLTSLKIWFLNTAL
jgi:hypothetical protein